MEQEPHRSALYYWYRWLLYSFSSDTDSRYQITSMYIFIQRNTYFSFVHIIWSLQTCVKICSCRNFYQLIGFLPGNVINHDCLSSYRYVDNWPIPAPGASKHKREHNTLLMLNSCTSNSFPSLFKFNTSNVLSNLENF